MVGTKNKTTPARKLTALSFSPHDNRSTSNNLTSQLKRLIAVTDRAGQDTQTSMEIHLTIKAVPYDVLCRHLLYFHDIGPVAGMDTRSGEANLRTLRDLWPLLLLLSNERPQSSS